MHDIDINNYWVSVLSPRLTQTGLYQGQGRVPHCPRAVTLSQKLNFYMLWVCG